ncbi:helix-turn-helix domain-containing protein [Sporolactobacillus sp. Y61]|uniref:Helix-turn-helix domain-containing protein n=1 Tax=Sporolactobacillus sp. Y61 TaxID=3160863 RepID=A0AAU8IDP3_9BACL
MPFLHYILLFMVDRMHGERTISGIYHILQGRQSVQTIQDSFLFHVRPFYHTMEHLDRTAWQSSAKSCQASGWIAGYKEKESYILTESGKSHLNQLKKTCPLPRGLKFTEYAQQETLFWLKIQLVVQTLSEMVHGHRSFFPVTNRPDVAQSVRHFLLNMSLDPEKLAHQVYTELHDILQLLSPEEAHIIVAQLSGAGDAGLTMDQLAASTGYDRIRLILLFKSALRQLMDYFHRNKSKGYILADLLPGRAAGLSHSAEQTYFYLKKGLPFTALSRKRKLSQGTIEDHLVEIALKVDDFDISPFLTEELDQLIIRTALLLRTRRLKPIKDQLRDKASYFQIRLSLARQALREKA